MDTPGEGHSVRRARLAAHRAKAKAGVDLVRHGAHRSGSMMSLPRALALALAALALGSRTPAEKGADSGAERKQLRRRGALVI